MSDLLQRMVQRTRMTQPAIRPAPVSRYAPDAPEIGKPMGSGERESEAQSDFLAAAPQGIQAQDRSFDQAQDRGFGQAQSRSKPSRRPSTTEAKESRTPSTRVPIGPFATDRGTALPPGEIDAAASVLSMENSGGEFVAAAERPKSALGIPPRLTASFDGSLAAQAGESFRHKTVRDAADLLRLDAVPVAQPSLARATLPAVQGREEPSQAESAPEINISIGHIEVRAARVAESPRKPAFRPQLSLHDFLHGKSGATR